MPRSGSVQGGEKNEGRLPAISGAGIKRREAPVRIARTAAFRQSAPGRRTPILSPFSSSGIPGGSGAAKG